MRVSLRAHLRIITGQEGLVRVQAPVYSPPAVGLNTASSVDGVGVGSNCGAKGIRTPDLFHAIAFRASWVACTPCQMVFWVQAPVRHVPWGYFRGT